MKRVSGVASEGVEKCCHRGRHTLSGDKTNTMLKKKKPDFLGLTNFKLLGPIRGNSIYNCNFLSL
jgi:hypothetical protein